MSAKFARRHPFVSYPVYGMTERQDDHVTSALSAEVTRNDGIDQCHATVMADPERGIRPFSSFCTVAEFAYIY